jgi:hypothetical protein
MENLANFAREKIYSLPLTIFLVIIHVDSTKYIGYRPQLAKSTDCRVDADTFETGEGSSRTNNLPEGWSNHFQHLVGHKHPTI